MADRPNQVHPSQTQTQGHRTAVTVGEFANVVLVWKRWTFAANGAVFVHAPHVCLFVEGVVIVKH